MGSLGVVSGLSGPAGAPGVGYACTFELRLFYGLRIGRDEGLAGNLQQFLSIISNSSSL